MSVFTIRIVFQIKLILFVVFFNFCLLNFEIRTCLRYIAKESNSNLICENQKTIITERILRHCTCADPEEGQGFQTPLENQTIIRRQWSFAGWLMVAHFEYWYRLLSCPLNMKSNAKEKSLNFDLCRLYKYTENICGKCFMNKSTNIL